MRNWGLAWGKGLGIRNYGLGNREQATGNREKAAAALFIVRQRRFVARSLLRCLIFWSLQFLYINFNRERRDALPAMPRAYRPANLLMRLPGLIPAFLRHLRVKESERKRPFPCSLLPVPSVSNIIINSHFPRKSLSLFCYTYSVSFTIKGEVCPLRDARKSTEEARLRLEGI